MKRRVRCTIPHPISAAFSMRRVLVCKRRRQSEENPSLPASVRLAAFVLAAFEWLYTGTAPARRDHRNRCVPDHDGFAAAEEPYSLDPDDALAVWSHEL